MKICTAHHIPWQILLLSFLTIFCVRDSDAKLGHVGWAKSDSRTKQLLQNIRTHIAQQEEQQQQLKECDPKISPCNVPVKKEADDDDSEEDDLPDEEPFRFRGRQKAAPPPKKDASYKDRKSMMKKKEKESEAKYANKKAWRDEDEPKTFRKKIMKDDEPIRFGKKVTSDDEPKSFGKKSSKDRDNESKKFDKKLTDDDDDDDDDDVPKSKKTPKEDLEKRGKEKIKDVKDKTKPEVKLKVKKPPESQRTKGEKNYKKEEEKQFKYKGFEKQKSDALEEQKKSKPKEKVEKRSKKPKSFEKKDKDENVRFPEDVPVFSLALDSVKSEQCKKHSRIYLRQLQRYKLWALMMYDATAKLPSGILQGNVNQYGDFDQCISVNASFKQQSRDGVTGIQGKYCLATIDISTESEDAGLRHAIHRSQSFGFVKSNIDDPGHFIPRFSTINWGLCIPSVCKAEDLENSIRSCLDSYKKKSGISFDVKVEDKNCVTKEDLLSDYDMKTFMTSLIYAVVIAVASYATMKDKSPKALSSRNQHEAITNETNKTNDTENDESNKTYHGKLKSIIMAFSLKRNMKKLFIEEESEDSIDCIHGIKSIFTMMLYFAHKTIPLALTPFSNRVVLTEISNESSSIFLRASIVYTDSFLLISGVLTAFNMGKEIQKRGRILWVRRIVARYIRLTPALLFTLLFYAYISNNLGSGPLWNVVVKENSRLCQQNMWRNLLYIQNFYPFEEMCAAQTHQLALDMQLFLLSPLLVYFLHTYDKIGIGILQALLMVSSILRFITTKNYELSLFIYHGMPLSQLYTTANLMYSQPIYRATPYIIGVLTGYYLQRYGKNFKLPTLVIIVGWISAACLAIGSFVSPAHIAKQNYKYTVEEAAHYAALIPIAWSAALAWTITACYLGYGGKLNKYLCSRGFLIFSRISYSVYLLQFLVFSHIAGSKKIPEVFSVIASLDIVEFLIIISISIAMTLLLDIPTVEIKRVVLSLFPSYVQKDTEKLPLLENEKDNESVLQESQNEIVPLEPEPVKETLEPQCESSYAPDSTEDIEDGYEKVDEDIDVDYPEDEVEEEPESEDEIVEDEEEEEDEEEGEEENAEDMHYDDDQDDGPLGQAVEDEPDFWGDRNDD